jgi:glycosyltransferase involved in cell wall biosynthesis
MVLVSIYLLCYNESILLPHTVAHYRKYLPNCQITIYDNESTDNSVKIAKSLGCNVISWSSNNKIDDFMYVHIKNNCWKEADIGWIIMADMDEWVCISEEDLEKEKQLGTTIIDIKGLQMVGTSKTLDLSDIDLHSIRRYEEYSMENKSLCFLHGEILDINYTLGAHKTNPIGTIQYSQKVYLNKHMSYLGLEFTINKLKQRYDRSHEMRNKGIAIHYINDIDKITKEYTTLLSNSITKLFDS